MALSCLTVEAVETTMGYVDLEDADLNALIARRCRARHDVILSDFLISRTNGPRQITYRAGAVRQPNSLRHRQHFLPPVLHPIAGHRGREPCHTKATRATRTSTAMDVGTRW